MQIKSHVYPSAQLEGTSALPWQTLRQYTPAPVAQFAPSTWVRVYNPPTAFSFDEAWLLCQCSDDQWLGWIPDYGEILLHTSEFGSLD